MPVELYRTPYTSSKRAKAQGKRALGQMAGQVAQSLIDQYKQERLREGHIDRLLQEVEYNLLGEIETGVDLNTNPTPQGTMLKTEDEADA